MADLVKIGKMAEIAGVRQSTIRYYTDIGLVKVADHTSGGQKLYDPEDTLKRVQIVKKIGRQRLSLDTIKNVIDDHKDAELK